MTELSPCALLTPIEMKLGKDGSAGKLISGTQARVVNISTGVDQPVYESGELLIRGPQVIFPSQYLQTIVYRIKNFIN